MRAAKQAPTLVKQAASLKVRGDSFRIVVVADTHSKPHHDALTHIAALKPDAILHAGDVGDMSVLAELARVAPVHSVRGNIDEQRMELPDALTLSIEQDDAVLIRLLIMHIAVAGPRVRGDAARLARSEKVSLVVCGHSHVPFITQDRGLTVFNPGSIGPRRFALPIVFGTIELENRKIQLKHFDCETGREWSPPQLP